MEMPIQGITIKKRTFMGPTLNIQFVPVVVTTLKTSLCHTILFLVMKISHFGKQKLERKFYFENTKQFHIGLRESLNN